MELGARRTHIQREREREIRGVGAEVWWWVFNAVATARGSRGRLGGLGSIRERRD